MRKSASALLLAFVCCAPQMMIASAAAPSSAAGLPFVRVEGDLRAGGPSDDGIPFDSAWVGGADGTEHTKDAPSRLPVPTFVQVFNCDDAFAARADASGEGLLKGLGRAAREIVDSSTADVVLFRNLSGRVRDAEDFATFWGGCLEGPDAWTPMAYVPFGPGRSRSGGVDLVTPFPPEVALPAHNEMSYNPREAGRIAFFCLEDASEGGETILTRNADLNGCVSLDLQRMVKDHGGIIYRREYIDGNAAVEEEGKPNGPPKLSWQEKTGTDDREEAVRFFTDIGFTKEEEVKFDENGTLIVQNIHSGFIDAPPAGSRGEGQEKLWFNILGMGVFKLADGTIVPPDMIEQLKKDVWKAAHALKLRPGDWIVINNRAVQHGRLPFVDSPNKKRTILTVYTD